MVERGKNKGVVVKYKEEFESEFELLYHLNALFQSKVYSEGTCTRPSWVTYITETQSATSLYVHALGEKQDRKSVQVKSLNEF